MDFNFKCKYHKKYSIYSSSFQIIQFFITINYNEKENMEEDEESERKKLKKVKKAKMK
jgi:hypothetical protein